MQIYKLTAIGKLRRNRALGKLLIEQDCLVELLEPPRPPPAPELPPPPQRPRDRPKKMPRQMW